MPQRSKTGRWIAHPADRVNAARALIAPLLFFAPFVSCFAAGYETVYAVIIFVFIGKTNYLLHLHIHRPYSRKRILNLVFDLSMGAVTGMASSNWRKHLYGHHCGVDPPYRGDRTWHMEKYSPLRAVSYSIVSLWQTFYGPIVSRSAREYWPTSNSRSATGGLFASRSCCLRSSRPWRSGSPGWH